MPAWPLRQETDVTSTAAEGLGACRCSDTVRQAAHDLRQPLAAVLALASATLADPEMSEQVRRRLEQMVAEANYLSKIIRDMLYRTSASQRAEAVNIVALVRDAVTSEQLASASPIMLHQPGGEPRYVIAGSTRLRRALANVLHNATRAAGPCGHVHVNERLQGQTELIEILDDGPGFGSGTGDEGIGLGLQITREMLAECGGQMDVERLSSGVTAVRLSLPIVTHGRTAGGSR